MLVVRRSFNKFSVSLKISSKYKRKLMKLESSENYFFKKMATFALLLKPKTSHIIKTCA